MRLANRNIDDEPEIAASSGSSINHPKLSSGDNPAPTVTMRTSKTRPNSEMSWASNKFPVRARWAIAAKGAISQATAPTCQIALAPATSEIARNEGGDENEGRQTRQYEQLVARALGLGGAGVAMDEIFDAPSRDGNREHEPRPPRPSGRFDHPRTIPVPP